MDELESFWVVWQPSGRNPTFMHKTFESAESESKRLAEQCPGIPFYVLEVMARALRPLPGTHMRYTKNHLAICTPPF